MILYLLWLFFYLKQSTPFSQTRVIQTRRWVSDEVPQLTQQFASSGNSNDYFYSNKVIETLGNFLNAKNQGKGVEMQEGTRTVKPRRKTTMKRLAQDLESALRKREWLVTGNVDKSFFGPDFEFSDPDVSVTGVDEYAQGVNRLFDQSCSRAEIISTNIVPNSLVPTIRISWRCSGRVNVGPLGLEIKPYVVFSDFEVDERSGLLKRQTDTFSIPGSEILLWALFPFARPLLPPPAPSLEELMKVRGVVPQDRSRFRNRSRW